MLAQQFESIMDYFKIRNLFTEHQKKHIMFKQYKNNFKLIYTAIYQIKRWDIEKKYLEQTLCPNSEVKTY